MVGSAWRQPYLAELTFGEMFRLVNSHVSGHKLRILEVGCGRGYLSLELARRGHDLLGIDVNEETIKIAKQTMNTDPYSLERGDWSTKFQILLPGMAQRGSLTS